MIYAINGSEDKRIIVEGNDDASLTFILQLKRMDGEWYEIEITDSRWLADEWVKDRSLMVNPEAEERMKE